MNAPVPAPERRKRYEYRASTCPKHANRCAERRERHVRGPWECVFCAHAAHASEMLQEPAPAQPDAPRMESVPNPPPAAPDKQPADATAVAGAGIPLLDTHRACACRQCVPALGSPELAPTERGLPAQPAPASASQTPAELKTHSDALVLLARALESGRGAAEVARELRRIGHEVDGIGRRLAWAAKGGAR